MTYFRSGLLSIAVLTIYTASADAQVSVLTNRNDNLRTGQNTQETILNRSNVNVSQFGKIFAQAVDGQVYAQPLYVPGVSIPGSGSHNVVYVATMNDSVYAFDADSNTGANANPLWMVNFTNPAAGITTVPSANVQPFATDIMGPIGIMGTPVIDPSTGTIYLVARTLENGTYVQKLHALDITNGAEKFGGPVAINATVSGTNNIFSPKGQNQRAGLALANGQVYITWASHNDNATYGGWVITYNATTLAQTAAFNDTPTGNEGGIWQAGQAPAIDAQGNAYFSTGNGTWDGTRNFSMSVIKLNPGLTLTDWFTPDNYSYLNANDLDLGSSGPLLIPNTNLLLAGGKPGVFFLLNANTLGNFANHNSQIPQSFLAANGHIHGSPTYWNSPSQGPLIYILSEFDYLKAFQLSGNTLIQQPVMQSIFRAPDGMPGGFMTITSNGSTPNSGIIWLSTPLAGDANHQTVQGIVRAVSAEDLTNVLWDSQQNASRDDIGNFAKYVPPTVANGKVYMATFSNQLVVYGLLNNTSDFSLSSIAPSQSVAPGNGISFPVTVGNLQAGVLQGTVTFSVSGLPGGATSTFSPASLNKAGSTSLNVTAGASLAPGTYPLTVTAVNGSTSHALSLSLVVSASAVGVGPGNNVDVGGASPAGSGNFNNGTYTVSGAGADIWGTSDQFHFTYWQLSGDGAIVARVVSPANAGFYSKSGVMIRETLAANSTYAFLQNSPSIYGFQYRNLAGVAAATTPYFTPSYPQWVKVVRANGNFSGYVSSDGQNWKQVGDSVSINMAQTVFVGLAVCSQSSGTLSSATFDNVSYTQATSSTPDFSISTVPAAFTSSQLVGSTLPLPVTVTPANGFSGAVTFSATGLPSGGNYTSTSVPAGGSGSLPISSTAATPVGTYAVTIRAVSGTLARAITISLKTMNFAISASPKSQTITAGGNTAYSIIDNDINGYSGLATVSVSGLPAGATAFFEPNGVDRIVNSVMTIYTTPSTPAGTYTLTVTGTSNMQPRTTTVTLVVNSSPDFAIGASPSQNTVSVGAAASYGVSTTAVGGFASAVSLSASGLPTGASATFNPTSITGAGSSTLAIQTGASTPAGSYSIVVTGTSGSLSHSTTVTLNVTTPVFGNGQGSNTDIGNPARAGSASLSGSTYTVNGAGADIWFGSDQFNFNYWPISGDGVFTARVVSLTNTSTYAKAGVMIRQSLSSNSAYAFAEASPGIYSLHYRTFAKNYSSQGPYFNATYPIWLRLVRSNGNFTAYSSSDGQNWTQTNQTVSVAMTGTIYAGLAVTSQNPGATATGVFDNLSFTPLNSSAPDFTINPSPVTPAYIASGQSTSFALSTGTVNGFNSPISLTVTGMPAGVTAQLNPATVTGAGTTKLTVTTSTTTPAGWYALTVSGTSGGVTRTTAVALLLQNQSIGGGTNTDIGSPTIAGSAALNAGVFTVNGSGRDIWQTSDQFNFNWWQVTGDVTLTARLVSVTNTNFYTKAGIMIRETLDPSSEFAFAVGIPTLFNCHNRATTGGNATGGGYFTANYPLWLRLVRQGGTFTAYSSADGISWKQINSPASISMASSVYVGLAVTSHDVTQTATAVFDNVTFTQP